MTPKKGTLMSHTYSNLLSHVIFSTKDRQPLIHLNLKPRLLGYINRIANENGGKVLASNATTDHLHMLWELKPTYAAFSVSRSNVSAVANYIDAQKRHHRTRTFHELSEWREEQ